MVQKHSTPIEWRHFEVVLHVGRARSIRQAAAALGVAHTTLAKRVSSAEAAFGAVAFVRGPQGYALTDAGHEIMLIAERMEAQAQQARIAVQAHDQRPTGKVVVSVMVPVLTRILAPALPEFHKRFPDIEITFNTSYRIADIRQQKADVAVRFQNSPDDYLVGRRVVTQFEAPYVSRDLLTSGFLDERNALPLIGWGARADVEMRARRHGIEAIDVVCTVEELEAQKALVVQGAGVGILPCFVCANDPELVRWPAQEPQSINDGWVLTHPDLAASTRVKVVADFCFSAMKQAKDRFAGKA
jgi:DNA-binding transcriptional LysR family regulator